MILTFHLVAAAAGTTETSATVSEDILIVDGTAYDFSGIAEGGSLDVSGTNPFVGPVTRTDGVVSAQLRWIYDMSLAERDQPGIAPTASIASGAVPDPVSRM